jgi:RNA polymerase sigma-70 factor (ECF subfamily)
MTEPGLRPDLDGLYRRDLRAVVALAYALSGSRSAAEELAQEAFLEAHRAWDRISAYDDPGAWVRRVVANRAISRVRRGAAEARALARVAGRRELPAELSPVDEEFWRAVRSLPDRQAQIVTLHYLEDRPVADIAALLDISPQTVKVHLHRGRQALARALGCDPVPDASDEEDAQP